MSVRKSARYGYAAAAAAAILWAVGGAYARRLIDRGASFVELTEARAWVTALVLGGALWLRRSRRERAAAPVSPVLVVVFGLSIAAANFTYYASLSKLPLAVAITVQYTAPVLVVVWTAVEEGFRPSRRMTAALAAAVAGVVLLAELPVVVREGHLRLSGAGFALAVASAFAFALYMISGERVGRALGAHRAVAAGFGVASVLWICVQAVRGRPHTLLDATYTPGILFLAVATTLVPFWLFLWGVERVRASRAGIVSTLEPLTAALIAFVWLGQSLSGWQVVGGLMVLCGVAVVQMDKPAAAEVLVERAALGE
jgi:drug/metabolite transporter (DMT)-like permease